MGITFSDEFLDVHLDTTVVCLTAKKRKKEKVSLDFTCEKHTLQFKVWGQ